MYKGSKKGEKKIENGAIEKRILSVRPSLVYSYMGKVQVSRPTDTLFPCKCCLPYIAYTHISIYIYIHIYISLSISVYKSEGMQQCSAKARANP